MNLQDLLRPRPKRKLEVLKKAETKTLVLAMIYRPSVNLNKQYVLLLHERQKEGSKYVKEIPLDKVVADTLEPITKRFFFHLRTTMNDGGKSYI